MRQAALLLAMCATLLLGAGRASAETVDYEELLGRLERIAAGRESDLAGVDAVRLPDGTIVRWQGDLATGEARAETAGQLADALEALVGPDGRTRSVDVDRAVRTADDVLAPGDDRPNWLERLLDWIGERLERLLGGIGIGGGGGGGAGGAAQVGVLALLATALAVTTVLVVRRLRRRWAADEDADEDAEGDGVSAPHTRRRRPAEAWELHLSEALAAGRYEEALRWLHLGGILRLDRDGYVRFETGRTNGRYAAALVDVDGLAAADLRRINRTTEDAVFGGLPAHAEDVDRMRAEWDGLLRTLSDRGGGQP